MPGKTDNHNLDAKLDLRRALLQRYQPDVGFTVCDCFSGSEALWSRLREEFPVRNYLALDVKAKRGRLKLDSLRYLQNQKWDHDVIDLDAYGAPWRHWFEVLKHGRPCTVFLTIGVRNVARAAQQREAIQALGIPFKIPTSLESKLAPLVPQYCISKAFDHGFHIPLLIEAKNDAPTRYLGLRLEHIEKTPSEK
jgi:hypothetical protein